MEIPNHTVPAQRGHFAQSSATGGTRNKVEFAVFLQWGRPLNIVIRASTCWVPNWLVNKFFTRAGQPYKGVSAAETSNTIKDYSWLQFIRRAQCNKYSKPRALFWDNAQWHTAPSVLHTCEQLGIQIFNTPPKSPDLNPNDSHVFANAKNKWLELLRNTSLNWETKAEHLEAFLVKTNARPHIEAWALSLVACELMKGKDFKDALYQIAKNAYSDGNRLMVNGQVIAYFSRR